MPANRADAAALKKEGNDAMKRGAYKAAVEAYTAAIDLWMENSDRAVLYSNRAAARLKMPGEATKALSDAERACALHPTYAKAHFRRGQALRALKKDIPAAHAMHQVLALAPGDAGAVEELRTLPVVDPDTTPPPAPSQEPPRAPTPPHEPPPQEPPPPPPAAPPAAAPPPPPGSRVRLVGLVGRADLNGATGEVLPATKPGERVPVRLDDPGHKRESLLLQPRNLVVLADDPEPTER